VYWPRGVSKAKVDVYKRILGPTRELLKAVKEAEIDWRAYEHAYLTLMAGEDQQAEIKALAEAATTGVVTIMCMCKDEAQCHRRLLADLVERVKFRRVTCDSTQ
jgi:uncharacterized protein YeaO (DUF488 family)